MARSAIQLPLGRLAEFCRKHRVRRLSLFGSALTDRFGPDSDIDLLVVQREVAEPRRASVQIRDALRGLGYPFDVVVMDQRRYEETRPVPGSLAHAASGSGRVILAAA